MSQEQEQIKQETQNEIQIRKKAILYIHNDGFNDKSFEPLVLVDGEKIHLVMIKKKYPFDMYYVFQSKRYIKLWNDKKGNILTFINNWSGDLFVTEKQSTEYINYFSYTVGENELICETKEGQKKKLILQGFDILSLIINEFYENANAILYILCTKLS
jgi:hypothetical protein